MTSKRPRLWDVLSERTGRPRDEAKLLAYQMVYGTAAPTDDPRFWSEFGAALADTNVPLAGLLKGRRR